jgi:ankyrin repeat protein
MQLGNTPLYAAALKNNAATALELLQYGADVDVICVSVQKV